LYCILIISCNTAEIIKYQPIKIEEKELIIENSENNISQEYTIYEDLTKDMVIKIN